MGIRVNTRISDNVSASFPIGWIVVGASLAGIFLLGGAVYAVQYVVGHPLAVLGEIAKGALFLSVLGAALYGLCWMLAHRGRWRD